MSTDCYEVRAIRYAEVEISPVTVLIGENGTGKSTIIECLEILRKAAEPSFFSNGRAKPTR